MDRYPVARWIPTRYWVMVCKRARKLTHNRGYPVCAMQNRKETEALREMFLPSPGPS
jgi:hypothetical protein